jgi:DNA invertase Pin-like site-specific DNA recombinase
MAQIVSVFGELERRLIGERTKAVLAVKRSQGAVLGRPRTLPDKVVERIVRERAKGRTWTAIAEALNADRIPTAQGGLRWYPATVRSVATAEYRRLTPTP